jgi:hypothetical protein
LWSARRGKRSLHVHKEDKKQQEQWVEQEQEQGEEGERQQGEEEEEEEEEQEQGCDSSGGRMAGGCDDECENTSTAHRIADAEAVCLGIGLLRPLHPNYFCGFREKTKTKEVRTRTDDPYAHCDRNQCQSMVVGRGDYEVSEIDAETDIDLGHR